MSPSPAGASRAPLWRALLLAALLLLLQAAGAGVAHALRLEAGALAQGQWWRLLGAHLVHLGWAHALMNALGVLVCWALAPGVFDRALPWRLAGLALGVGAGLWALVPQALPYVGLSGVLYGLFVLGLVPLARARDPIAALSLRLISGWLAWQWAQGAAPAEERLIGGRIVGEAHLLGVGLALLWLALKAGWRRVARPAA